MPNGTKPVTLNGAVEIGLTQRDEDGYFVGVSIGFHALPFAVNVDPDIALDIAQCIIEQATVILSQSAAACGCDAKVNWTCDRHTTTIDRDEATDES
jgi:hypothetical protein